jgi:radical SAM superfamily enzyme YgiQ (UPF0313 family)
MNCKHADVVLISVEEGPLPSFGIPSLDAYLSQSGIISEILYPKVSAYSLDDLIIKISELNPSVVGIGGLFNDRFIIKKIIDGLRPYRKNFKIVIGGNLVTPIPEFMLQKLSADIVVVGEGEIIFTKLVKKIIGGEDYSDIGGLVFREGNNVVTSGKGEYIEDLNELVRLNYEKIPMEYFVDIYKFYRNFTRNNLYTPSSKMGTVFTGRGCPHRCNFCYHFNKLRLLKIPAIIPQIKELKNRFKVNMITFADDLALVNKHRTLDLCRALINERLDLKYLATAHFAILDEEMVLALKEAGFVQLALGLESGSGEILKRMNKATMVGQIKDGLNLLRKHKISWNGGVQIGQLGETEQDVRKTIELFYPRIDELSTVSVVITTPFPGTSLYDYGLKLGIIKDMESSFYKIYDLHTLVANFSKISNWRVYYLRLKMALMFDLRKQQKISGKWVAYLFLMKILIKRFLNRIGHLFYNYRKL